MRLRLLFLTMVVLLLHVAAPHPGLAGGRWLQRMYNVPPPPFSPYGTVLVDGVAAAAGTVVSAWCGGIKYKETITQMSGGASWYFNLDIPGDDPETPGKDGCGANETVTFRIGAQAATPNALWTSTSYQLDLRAATPTRTPTATPTRTPWGTTATPTRTATPTPTPSATLRATPTATPASSNTKTKSFQQGVSPKANYAGAADAYLSARQPNANFGSATTLMVSGSSSTSKEQWALLKWNLSSIFGWPQSASLSLSILNHSGGQAYQLYEVLASWSESGITWANKPASGAALLGTVAPAANGTLTVSLNAAGVAVVQKWLTTPSKNYGFYLRNPANTRDMSFYSRDFLASPAMRPKLTVTYRPPVVINGPTVSNITAAGARVGWESDTYAKGSVRYRKQGTTTWTTKTVATVLTNGRWQATANTSGLSANTTYEYQVRASADSPWTSTLAFRTAVAAAAQERASPSTE